jgi:hypothetical protein
VTVPVFGPPGRPAAWKLKRFHAEDVAATLESIDRSEKRRTRPGVFLESGKLRFVRLSRLTSRRSGLRPVERIRALTRPWRARRLWTSADVVHVRNHLSVFFTDTGVRVKGVVPGGVRGAESLIREYAVREHVSAVQPSLGVPRLLGLVTEGPVTYLKDEIVDGVVHSWSSPLAHAAMARVVERMLALYEASGITWSSIAESLPDWQRTLTWASERRPADRDLMDRIKDRRAPVCIRHGDLSLGNVLVGRDSEWIIDWEKSDRGLLTGDLHKTLRRIPALVQAVETWFEQRRVADGLAEESCARLGTLLRLEDLRRGASGLPSAALNDRGGSGASQSLVG